MIALVAAMVWARRGQAVVLALLTVFAVAPAVAAPAYLRAADRVIAAGQVAQADLAERSVTVRLTEPDQRGDHAGSAGSVNLPNTGSALVDLPGFQYVYSAEYPTVGIEPDDRYRTRLVYRQDVCAHLVMVTGRCLSGEGDLVLGEQAARRLHLAAGDSVSLSYAYFAAAPDLMVYVADGAPATFLVVGTYRVAGAGGAYWGDHGYFAPEENAPGEPAFTGLSTMNLMERGDVQLAVDGSAGPGAMDVDRLPALRAALARLQGTVADLGAQLGTGGVSASGLNLGTSMPALMERIDSGRAAARRIVPVPAVALILLACLAVLIAAGAGAAQRRPESAVIALRGSRWIHRWWLATGESLIAVLAGTLLGVPAGQWLVDAVVALRFPGVGADPHASSLRYAPPAALAVMLTVLIAQSRPLTRPVTELLRRATRPAGRAGIAAEMLIAALAVAAVVQLRTSSAEGAGAAAPGLVILALALITARAVRPLTAWYAHRALDRGRPATGLTGLRLARRPGTARLFALLVAAVAVSGYAVAATAVASRGRAVEAGLGTGADRVLTVGPIGRSRLIAAVHAVDPDGAYAMAAVRITGSPGEAPVLAVESERLAAAANWPDGGPDAATVAAALRPAAAAPPIMTGTEVVLDLTAAEFRPGKGVTMQIVLSPVRGGEDVVAPMGVLQQRRHTYRYPVPQCAAGCRINAFRIAGGNAVLDVTGVVTVHGLAGVPALGEAGAWRASAGRLAAATDGLRIEVGGLDGLPEGMVVQPVDTPYPVPIAAAGAPPTAATGGWTGAVTGLDYRDVPVTVAARIPAVPQLGTPARLIDLEYADRLSTDGTPATTGQIWLGEGAPADVLERVAAQGVVVTGDLRAGQAARRLARQGPAVALGYAALVAVLVVLLAAGVLVLTAVAGRAGLIEDLTALRAQGLSRAAARRVALWSYPLLVAGAIPAGLAIGLGAWALTGSALPLAGLDPAPLPRPQWPGVPPMALTVLALLIVLGCTAMLAGSPVSGGPNRKR
ncbi:ABC transporter permease [Actinoplanes sp. NPDC051851]|uniref:ABC transporter permease n=1 Tax=Actinoplanes sp. NPDC051851 TaxID=3154753 RepID=UPI003449D906